METVCHPDFRVHCLCYLSSAHHDHAAAPKKDLGHLGHPLHILCTPLIQKRQKAESRTDRHISQIVNLPTVLLQSCPAVCLRTAHISQRLLQLHIPPILWHPYGCPDFNVFKKWASYLMPYLCYLASPFLICSFSVIEHRSSLPFASVYSNR